MIGHGVVLAILIGGLVWWAVFSTKEASKFKDDGFGR